MPLHPPIPYLQLARRMQRHEPGQVRPERLRVAQQEEALESV